MGGSYRNRRARESREDKGEGGAVQVGGVTERYGGKTGEGRDWALDRQSRRSSIGRFVGSTARLGKRAAEGAGRCQIQQGVTVA